jgi:hypothetical protein
MRYAKYRDLLVLLILLDEVESRCGELAERHPDLRGLAEAVSDAAGLCDLAMTVEEMEG